MTTTETCCCMTVPEVHMYSTFDTLSTEAEIDKTLYTKLDVILQ